MRLLEDNSKSGKDIIIEDEEEEEDEEDQEDLKDVDIDYISSNESDEGDNTQNFAGHSLSADSYLKDRSYK